MIFALYVFLILLGLQIQQSYLLDQVLVLRGHQHQSGTFLRRFSLSFFDLLSVLLGSFSLLCHLINQLAHFLLLLYFTLLKLLFKEIASLLPHLQSLLENNDVLIVRSLVFSFFYSFIFSSYKDLISVLPLWHLLLFFFFNLLFLLSLFIFLLYFFFLDLRSLVLPLLLQTQFISFD